LAVPIFKGNVIAVLWDFDQTLIPGYQQKVLFDEYSIDEQTFWRENSALPKYYRAAGIEVSSDTTYLNHLLTYVTAGKLPDLTNAKLKELGARLEFYPGIPEFLRDAKELVEKNEEFRRQEITVEHYIVSTGLRQMILGSAIASFVKGVWACEFIERPAEPGFNTATVSQQQAPSDISQIGYVLDNTTKTKAIWEINKGVNVDPRIGINDFIAQEDRRVPLRNMLYVADGPSDIPIFSILNQYGGRTLGVYNPSQDEHFKAVKRLSDQGRVQQVGEANYTKGTTTYRWIMASLEEMAEVIVRDRERALADRVLPPGGHVIE
jgi:hypothetical protein